MGIIKSTVTVLSYTLDTQHIPAKELEISGTHLSRDTVIWVTM